MNEFGPWDQFVGFVNRAGWAWKNLLGQDKVDRWTPSLGGSATYTTQYGEFVKIGHMVFVRFVLQVNSIGTGSTTVITGLPYKVGGIGVCACPLSHWGGTATSIVYAVGRLTSAQSDIAIYSATAADTVLDGSNPIFQNSTIVQGSGWYSL